MNTSITKQLSTRFANMAILCAMMVVAIHVLKRPQPFGTSAWWVRQVFGEGICRIAVPFFFFASGYFVANHFNESGWWRREVIKRLKSLMAPYLFWAIIGFLLVGFMLMTRNIMMDKPLLDGVFSPSRIVSAMGLNPFHVPELRQLWYLRVLFIFTLLSPLISKVRIIPGGVNHNF